MTYRLLAYNRAEDSANRVHEPEFARRVGFKGGLVPGVDVFAYMVHPVAEAWGLAWLRHGGLEARFVQPVYDGDLVAVDFDPETGRIELRSGGEPCATGTAERAITDPPPDPAAWPDAPAGGPLRPPEPASFTAPLGATQTVFTGADARTQLTEVREGLPVFAEQEIVHPGHLLRLADSILMANIDLPPWMHVSSRARFFEPAHWDQPLSTRALVRDVFEKKGHCFVQLDVLVAGPRGPVLRVDPYTAIYRPAWAVSI